MHLIFKHASHPFTSFAFSRNLQVQIRFDSVTSRIAGLHRAFSSQGMIPNHAWVVLLRDDGTKSLIRASRNSEVKSNNMRALGDQLIGHPYGSTFEFREQDDGAMPPGPHKTLEQLNEKRAKKRKDPLKYSRLVRVEPTQDAFERMGEDDAAAGDVEGEETTAVAGEEEFRDNRGYSGDTQNQKADSLLLQKSGVLGHDLVRELAKNNVTFNLKSKFSQEKYLRRLQRKHVPRVTVVRATSRTVSEVLFFKHQSNMSTDSLRALRWVDALPQMMAFGNVHATARCMVLDGTSGLLSLAILERLGDDGRCFFIGTNPREVSFGGGRAFINLLNMSRVTLAKRFAVCGSSRLKADGSVDQTIVEEEEQELQQSQRKVRHKGGNASEATKVIEDLAGEASSSKRARQAKEDDDNDDEADQDVAEEADDAPGKYDQADETIVRKLKEERRVEMFRILDVANGGPGADSLLIAARQEPWEALQVLLPHLGLGKPFAVHHPCLEPLMVAKSKLAESKSFLDLAVTETFCREYQVLPERTHPTMTGSATGGFILRGIKVQAWKD